MPSSLFQIEVGIFISHIDMTNTFVWQLIDIIIILVYVKKNPTYGLLAIKGGHYDSFC